MGCFFMRSARRLSRKPRKPVWRVFASSQRGPLNIERHKPNQDAVKSWASPNGGTMVCVAVADGHGDPHSFRSNVGASFATDVGFRLVFEELASPRRWLKTPSLVRLSHCVPHLLSQRWRREVRDHLRLNPLEHELAALDVLNDSFDDRRVRRDPLTAYGTTVVAVGVTLDLLLAFQIGDGGIVSVDRSGKASLLIPDDPNCVSVHTNSLAMPDSHRYVHVVARPLQADPPPLLFLCTDGYRNAFARSLADFLQVGPDILEIIGDAGWEEVCTNLPSWLSDATAYSKDDATLAVLHLPTPF